MKNKYLIFSDLDGTLLNHDDYSFAPAKEALKFLKSNSISLILATSKTFHEVIELHKELEIRAPFIVENGAGIFIPSECVLAKSLPFAKDWIKVSHAKTYIELRLFFRDMKRHYPMKGFGDMTLEEVMELTGLSEKNAKNSMKRDFSEPFILSDLSCVNELKEKQMLRVLILFKGEDFSILSLYIKTRQAQC